ncbi:MAG: orotate phosphoribosyltransferase [Nanoarchaeota archaeon]|nr:orotate phosphoribosyltransferase [Nanoarchaeota archaeon]
MDSYKQEFIDFLLRTGALQFGDRSLKSKRLSPYFVNIGDFSTGSAARGLGAAFASAIIASGLSFDFVFGPAYKGIPLAVNTASALAEQGKDTSYVFDRKEAKLHGEGTATATGKDLQKETLIGAHVNDKAQYVMVDDVLTTAATKDEALDLMTKVAKETQCVGLFIGVDRQEVGLDGKSAITDFTERRKVPVHSIVTAHDIYEHLKGRAGIDQAALERIHTYLRVYGTEEAREQFGRTLEKRIIPADRSVIPACDIETLEQFETLVQSTADIEKIGGYKIGFELGLEYGLPTVVRTARKHTDKRLIYDHQKAGTDIPDTGKKFARLCKRAGIDAVILFPEAGPETQRAWMYHALDQGLKVIVGGEMTHNCYKASEGGYLTEEGIEQMYRIAARAGITNFVVPGNKPQAVAHWKEVVQSEGIVIPTFYAPGFVAQGGKISDTGKVAGDFWHAIVGRDIVNAPDMRAAALQLTSQI